MCGGHTAQDSTKDRSTTSEPELSSTIMKDQDEVIWAAAFCCRHTSGQGRLLPEGARRGLSSPEAFGGSQ